jgi:hypothetical protein
MSRRLPVASSPGPLEDYAVRFDDLFRARAPREGFRRYLEGLLLAERNKTLTALTNTEPVVGAQRKEAQSLQWFHSESGWDHQELNGRRLDLLFEDSATASGASTPPTWASSGWPTSEKTENGVVSVSSVTPTRTRFAVRCSR